MIRVNGEEIKTVLSGVNWSGDKEEVSRSLSFSFIYSTTDNNYPHYQVKVGDRIEYLEDNKVLFNGYVESTSYTTDDDQVNVTAIDLMVRLLRSKCVGRFTGTLTQIANNICNLFGLMNGITSDSKQIHNIVSDGDLSYYDVLNTVCYAVYDRYCIYLDNKTLKVASHDVVGTFEIKKNIRSSSFNSNMTNMCNSVIVIDNDGKVLGKVQNADSLNKYGLFQQVYNYNKDVKNNTAEAQKLLKDLENQAQIVCDNDNSIISGSWIRIYEPTNNITGVFEVKTDSHDISEDATMTLEVEHVAS